MKLKVIKVTEKNKVELEPQIAKLEKEMSYPFGNDFFSINHGKDYFAFFHRMGELHYYVVKDPSTSQVIAVACGVIRKLRDKWGRTRKAWYLCDLKVDPKYRGHHIPLMLLKRTFFQNYLRCQRGYAISMNSVGQKQNRIEKLLSRFRWASISHATVLNIYSLDATAIQKITPVLKRHKGDGRFISLSHVKGLIVKSTGQPMPLLHFQSGEGAIRSTPNHTHMFCSPVSHPLALDLAALGISPSASATIIHHRMANFDWSFVLTSEI